MATNDNTNPATQGDQVISGTTGTDTLTGGFGNDTISGGDSADVLRGDGPVEGAWHFETYDYDFTSAAGQAFDIENGVRTGSGYVTDFDEGGLTNSVRGTTGNPEDFGVIYTSTLDTSSTGGGTYRLTTSSDDGSTIQIFDSAGNALNFANQTGGTLDYLNNDFHQGTTTRFGDVVLDPNETYTIQIRYWENRGGDTLAATISGPDTGGTTQSLLTSPMIGLPPGPEYSTSGVPAGVEGDDSISGGAGDDTIIGDGGNDTLDGGADNDSIDGGIGDDELSGGAGNDTLLGGDGNDAIFGFEDDDSIDGGAGDDMLDGDGGNDSITGGTGNDTLVGDAGNDTLLGGADNDQIFAGADDDSLEGGAGDDSLFGQTGDDTLGGGTGNDTLTGGDGFDTFVYAAGDGADTINDFNVATGQDINDADQGNNDFLDLSAFYTSVFEARTDLADDGLLNQSVGDFTDNTSMAGGSLSLTGVSGADLTFDNINVACFVAGTRIKTRTGWTPVEALRAGDLVQTLDHGLQPLRHRLQSVVEGRGALAPVVFARGTWGAIHEFAVSPMHRMFVSDWRAELLFGETEVLVPAKHLINGETIFSRPQAEVTYVHLIFDAHEIVLAEGVASESFHPAMSAAGAEDTRAEIVAIFPDATNTYDIPTARRTLRGYEAEMLSST